MGIPYSREINAAFEQVTPLVAAGFKVLRTTKNISIILAIIQVLTVLFLGAICVLLVGVLYCVNPDLEEERKALITPLLRRLAHITLFGVLKTLISSLVAIGLAGYVAWRAFLFEQWVEDVEYEANVDANQALEDLEGGSGKKGGKQGKKKTKEDADRILEEEGKK